MPTLVLDELKAIFGSENVIFEKENLEDYSRDASSISGLPDFVVKPQHVEEVQALMRIASKKNFPVTPRGLGTGLAGGAVPIHGGVVISFEKMNSIKLIDTENLLAEVEPGVITGELKKEVEKRGLFYPPDPASFEVCSIGGNVATNAGGPACLKYGTTRDYVLALDIVLADGTLIRPGVKTRKGVVGYDLVGLFTGSEGTLGLITSVLVKLVPKPKSMISLLIPFSTLAGAMKCVTTILNRGFIPSAMEFLDEKCLNLAESTNIITSNETCRALLIIEFDDIDISDTEDLQRIYDIAEENGAINIFVATDSVKRNQIWELRRKISLDIEHSSEVYIPEDIVVPIGSIAKFASLLPEYEKEFKINIYTFGHAGDGNIHLNITASSKTNINLVNRGIRAILKKVVELGGTISGEHGIGCAKLPFIDLELTSPMIELQKSIKNLFDPLNILNPGKIFD